MAIALPSEADEWIQEWREKLNESDRYSEVGQGWGVGFDGSFAASSRFVTAKGCLNCHSQVHGTNHPSGVSLTR